MQNLKITDFKNKRVWLIGASSGIGRALCLELANRGAVVYASARNQEALNELKNQFQNTVIPLPLDVMKPEQIKTQFSNTKDLDMVIYLAADYKPLSLFEINSENCSKIIDVNLKGLINVLEVTLPYFKERKSGHFSAFASIAGYIGLPSSSIYGATKAAVINLFESLHPEAKNYGIDLSIVNPGFVKTPLTSKNNFPMPFIMTPEEAAIHTINGYEQGSFCIVYPKLFSYFFRFLRILPYGLHLSLAKKLIKT